MSPEQILQVLCAQHAEDLTSVQKKAFESMRDQEFELTQKQIDWVYGVAEKLGICVAPARNVFSRMTPEKRAEHARNVRTKLPWERGEQTLPKKPPGRRAE